MAPNEWTALVLSSLTILTIGFGAFNKWVTHRIRDIVSDEFSLIKKELTNNGGSSTKDKIDNNTIRLERVEHQVDSIYNILIEKKD
jgi:hypothetical protein